jgi:hypothetical protein
MVVDTVPRGADVDDGGVVAAVAKLAGCVDRYGDRYGESDADDGECDNGVVDSDVAFGGGRWICEGGRGIATLGEARTACGPWPFPPLIGGSTTDVDGEDKFEDDRLCVGWKYGSWADKPMRLSTGRPNYRVRRKNSPREKGQEVGQNVIKTYPYPSPVLDQLFPVYFIKPRYPDKLALGVHQAVAQVFVLATHGFQHVLGIRGERIGQTEKGRRLGAVAIDSCARATRRGSSILLLLLLLLLVGGELLCKSQR